MIWDYSSGKRILNTDPAYKKVLEKIKSDFPGFVEGARNMTIVSKKSFFRKKTRYVGTNETDATAVGEGLYPPKPQILTETGQYIDEKGNKIQAIFSVGAPTYDQNGKPEWPHQEAIAIHDGFHISSDDMDKAVWLYGFKPELDGGVYKNEGSKFMFDHPELNARHIRRKPEILILQEEILYEGTCMTYKQVSRIMEILGVTSRNNEDLDRESLFNFVSAMKDRSPYESARATAISDAKTADPASITKTVQTALKSGVIFEDDASGMFKLKKSDLESSDIIRITGTNKDEKKFELTEYFSLNVSAFEELQKLTV